MDDYTENTHQGCRHESKKNKCRALDGGNEYKCVLHHEFVVFFDTHIG
jgi:hypothetical protein